MKTLIIMLFSCILLQSTFQDKILNDFDSNSRFLVVKVKSSKYNGSVIIENDNLYVFLNQRYSLDKNQYVTFVKKVLNNNLSIKINDNDFKKYDFYKLKASNEVDKNFKKGIHKFVNIYFNNGKVLKDNISDDVKDSIIEKLFISKISVYIDDESGYLVIG